MRSLSIHITDQCNNSCKFCVVNSHKDQKERVDRQVIYRFLEKYAEQGYESVNIHGGEPTLIPELPDVLQKIRELGYPSVSIQTNGRILADMEFAKKVTELGADLLVISMHGKDAATHDFVTDIPGSFDEAVQGIKNVKALGKKVRTNTVVCNQNLDSLSEIMNNVLDLGVDHVNLSAIHPAGKAFKNFKLVAPKLTSCMEAVQKAVDTANSRNATITLEGYPPCVLGSLNKYVINWDDISWKMLFHKFEIHDYNEFMENETRVHGAPCKKCIKNEKCGGVYKEYIYYSGWDEFQPITEREEVLK